MKRLCLEKIPDGSVYLFNNGISDSCLLVPDERREPTAHLSLKSQAKEKKLLLEPFLFSSMVLKTALLPPDGVTIKRKSKWSKKNTYILSYCKIIDKQNFRFGNLYHFCVTLYGDAWCNLASPQSVTAAQLVEPVTWLNLLPVKTADKLYSSCTIKSPIQGAIYFEFITSF